MRVGILLILLQSVLLCAEARAEGQVLLAESTDKVVRALLLDSDTEQSDEPDASPVPTVSTTFSPTASALILRPEARLSQAVYTAHPIRGPPVGQ
ncbi:hypothetical protein [Microbulbifer elongatus]|uniref:hypothetical protein n=1 Tax=Microbulbifer elongatus TaxID=86173 RepID=UPI001CFE841B|nr:hypothetical protein [Microbulbifer elongatus]